jgi:murein DD-endopeptidase MepM/ murein hydrolase activator NlpD
MFSDMRTGTALVQGRHGRAMAIAIALGLSGCSADVTRFDFPAFNLTDNASKPTGSLPEAGPSAQRRPAYDDAPPGPPRGAGLAGEGGRPLPPTGERMANAPAPYTDSPPPPAYDRYATRPAPMPPPERRASPPPPPGPRYTASGETVEVQQGDTLYGLARRHNVPVSALIELNNLDSNNSIRPGQRLALPAGARTLVEPAPGRAPVVKTAAPAVAPQATPGWEATHTMKNGESLYGIARQYRVTLAELQRVNGITEPTRVRAGAVLHVPNGGPIGGEPMAERGPPPPPAAPPSARIGQGPSPTVPKVINAAPERMPERMPERTLPERRVASVEDIPADTGPAIGEPPTGKFRWPVRGRVIAGFGRRPDGTQNDGINLAVPQGTDIHAAEGGRVAYAGNEIRAYGNLILIRHDNGWVTAYAHNDQILVKRDDVVRRGQVIAKAGRTGTVDQPQVHFELRQGAKPVDPLPHMERN